MNIAILIYSKTDHTLQVAQKIKDQLESQDDTATIERINVVSPEGQSPQDMALKDIPNLTTYEKIIIGAPINKFSLCVPMRNYLKNHADVKDKDINCFVTQQFKHSFLGGNRGIRQINAICGKKGGNINNISNIHWSSANRENEIIDTVKVMTDFS